MRVMVMAAGKGTRLRPVTDLLPKPMAPVANRPVLHHILRLLKRHGFGEVVLNLHHCPRSSRSISATARRWASTSTTRTSRSCSGPRAESRRTRTSSAPARFWS